MKLTMERYAELDKTSYFKEEYDGYVKKYNKKHGTKYKYQYEMIHDLYENHDMNACGIARIFNMCTAAMGVRVRKLGIKTKGSGCAKCTGRKPKKRNCNGKMLTIREASEEYGIKLNTIAHRMSKQKLSISQAVNKPVNFRLNKENIING